MIDLETYLMQNKVWHKFIQKPETVHTADAARVAGVELRKVTKNLVSVTDKSEYVVLIVPGDKCVDMKTATRILGVRSVRLVPFDEAKQISGDPPGDTPSVGHRTRMRVIVDKPLLEYETIYCDGGSREYTLGTENKRCIEVK